MKDISHVDESSKQWSQESIKIIFGAACETEDRRTNHKTWSFFRNWNFTVEGWVNFSCKEILLLSIGWDYHMFV